MYRYSNHFIIHRTSLLAFYNLPWNIKYGNSDLFDDFAQPVINDKDERCLSTQAEIPKNVKLASLLHRLERLTRFIIRGIIVYVSKKPTIVPWSSTIAGNIHVQHRSVF